MTRIDIVEEHGRPRYTGPHSMLEQLIGVLNPEKSQPIVSCSLLESGYGGQRQRKPGDCLKDELGAVYRRENQ